MNACRQGLQRSSNINVLGNRGFVEFQSCSRHLGVGGFYNRAAGDFLNVL